MDFMSVLVPVTNEDADVAAIEAAIRIAQASGGVVRALYARGEPAEAAQFRYPSLGDSVFVQIDEAIRDSSESREAKARDSLE